MAGLQRWVAKQGAQLRALVPAYDVLRVVLGLVLLAAAGLKGLELSTQDLAARSFWDSRLFLSCVVVGEIALGLWLLCGLYASWSRWTSVTLFLAFFELNLFQGLAGEKTCRCLGKIGMSPWIMVGFDLTAVWCLLVLGRKRAAPRTVACERRTLAVFCSLLLLLAVPAILTMANYTTGGVTLQLRNDDRLQRRVRLDVRGPGIRDLLTRLQSGSKVALAVDPRLEDHQPDYGRIGPSTVQVCSVMDMISQKQLIPARWVATEDGYELAQAAPWASPLTPWLVSALVFSCLLIGAGSVQIRCALRPTRVLPRAAGRVAPPAGPADAPNARRLDSATVPTSGHQGGAH